MGARPQKRFKARGKPRSCYGQREQRFAPRYAAALVFPKERPKSTSRSSRSMAKKNGKTSTTLGTKAYLSLYRRCGRSFVVATSSLRSQSNPWRIGKQLL